MHTHTEEGDDCAVTMERSPWTPEGECGVRRGVFTHQLPPYPSNTEVLGAFEYLTCVKLSAEDEIWAQTSSVTPQMSDSWKCRSISEDLQLALIDSALWERLKGPLTGNWYSQGILCTSVLDWRQTWNTGPLLFNFCHTGFQGQLARFDSKERVAVWPHSAWNWMFSDFFMKFFLLSSLQSLHYLNGQSVVIIKQAGIFLYLIFQ